MLNKNLQRPTKDLDLSSNVSRQNADESRTSYDFQTTNPEDVVVNAQNGRTVGQGYVQQGLVINSKFWQNLFFSICDNDQLLIFKQL